MFVYFAFALLAFAAEFSPEQFFENRADLEPNMAEFELVFVGEGCTPHTSSELETILRSVFTGGVSVSKSDKDNTEDVDIVIDDLDKIGAIPGLFPTCTIEVRNVETVNSELLPTPNHILDDLSDIMEVVNDQTLAESRRLLGQLPTEMSFKDNIGVARAQTSDTCAAFTASSIMEIHENLEWGKPTSTRFSPLSVYAYRSLPRGMISGKVFQILRDRGIAMETDWPIKGKSEKYVDSLAYSDVTLAVKKAALRHRIVELKRYTDSNQESLKQLFLKFGPAYVATSVYGRKGKPYDCDMWNKKPGYNYRGSHAMTAIAYNSKGILLRNSWGADWCDGEGNVLLPWNEVEKVTEFNFWKDAPTTDCVHFSSDTGYKCIGPQKASCASFPCKLSDAQTCCAETRKLERVCQDHIGTIATIGSTTYTCSSIASTADKDGCIKPLREVVEKHGAILGPNITPDMFPKDICPLVYKDICTTCASKSVCKDHVGIIATEGSTAHTCSSIKATEEGCIIPMRELVELHGFTLGPNITPDMYPKDICPSVYKDICTTCATTPINPSSSPSASPSKSPFAFPVTISTGPNSCDWSHQIPELHKYVSFEECALECAQNSQCKAFYMWVKNPYKSEPLCIGFSQECSGNLVSSSCPDNAWCGYNVFPDNIVEEDAPDVGAWGGSCTCPDGSVYQVGDNHDHCGSLACNGGLSGKCSRFPGEWSRRKVTCGTPINKYVHIPDKTCEDHGYETITTEKDCKAAGSLLKKGEWTHFRNLLWNTVYYQPAGCSFSRYGFVEIWPTSNMGECDYDGNLGCFCKKTSAWSFDFELRGRNGDELVTITDGEDKQTATLSTDFKKFSVHNKDIVITFQNDIGQRDVFFKSSHYTHIRSDARFSGWNCGTPHENVRCQHVRDGKFLWSGDYQITFGIQKKPRWTHIESRGCTNGKWFKIGTARSLNEAKQLMLNHQDCQKERSALFYSPHYSYDASWSVRCVLAEHSATCTENNRNWQAYVLTYQK